MHSGTDPEEMIRRKYVRVVCQGKLNLIPVKLKYLGSPLNSILN